MKVGGLIPNKSPTQGILNAAYLHPAFWDPRRAVLNPKAHCRSLVGPWYTNTRSGGTERLKGLGK